MKAIILAGGRGKRLNPYTKDINKCIIPFKGKPLIEYSLDCIAVLPVDEIIIVVGYRAEDIINNYGIHYKNKKIRYVIQQEQLGLVNAIECCQDALEGHDFLLFLGDEIMIKPYHQSMFDYFLREDLFGVCGVVEVADRNLISKTYSIFFGDDKRIYRLIEKPKNPLNNYMGTGNCIFKNELLSYIPITPINQNRKEKELPDLIQCAVDDGKVIKAVIVCNQYVNVNSEDDISIIESISSDLH